jgi:hypothetical protein
MISGNSVSGSHSGINPRYCRDLVMMGNVIVAYAYGIYAYNYIGNFTATGNTIRATLQGIRVGRDVDPVSNYGPLKIVANNIEGGENGVMILDATVGTVGVDIDVSANTIRSSKFEAVRIQLGDSLTATDGWFGKVNDNTIIDAGLIGGYAGMRLTNLRGGVVSENTFKGSVALTYAANVDGSGTGNSLQFMDNYAAPGLIGTRMFNTPVGSGHRSNSPPVTVGETLTVIAAGVATPKFASWTLISIDTEAAAAADDLDTLAASYIGATVTLRSATSTRVVTVRDGTGNIQLGTASRILDSTRDTLILVWDGVSWNEIAFSSNLGTSE